MSKQKTKAGEDREEAGRWLYSQIARRGLECDDVLTKPVAYGILARLKRRESLASIAAWAKLKKWWPVRPSSGQQWLMQQHNLPAASCKHDASLLLDAVLDPLKLYKRLHRAIHACVSSRDLDAVAGDIRVIATVLDGRYLTPLLAAGRAARAEISGLEDAG